MRPDISISPTNADKIVIERSCLRSKWVAIALIVSGVVIFGSCATFGGLGLFASQGTLPQWLAHAIGTVGHGGCQAMFYGGSALLIAFVVGGVGRLVSVHQKNKKFIQALDNEDLDSFKKYLRDPDVDVNQKNESGYLLTYHLLHPLFEDEHEIENEGENRIVPFFEELLKRQDLSINKQDDNHKTVLYYAIRDSKDAIVDLLLENPEIRVDSADLHLAIQCLRPATVKKLINRNGVDVNALDAEGDTPLHAAIYENKVEIVKELLKHKDIVLTIKDQVNRTPLQFAQTMHSMEQDWQEIIDLFSEKESSS